MSLEPSTKRSREDDTDNATAPVKDLPPTKKGKKDNKFIDKDILAEAEYYFKNGLRCVYPYYFTFTSYAKGRWIGSTIYNLFCTEFQAETPEYYAKALEAGKITVNGVVANKETMIKNNDLITHRVHRHEPPVIGDRINIIHKDDDLVVINKPPSIPVHPCGRYRHNTVWFIMAKEYGLTNLHTVHRIDRLTSGILIFARSVAAAQRLEKQIQDRKVNKKYLCKAEGEFPERIECSQPIKVECHRLGVCRVDPNGRPCSTVFERLHYDGTDSIVACYPKTGRMHQIRVHLQWLGYPIVNDPVYNHSAWGNSKGKGGVDPSSMDNIITEIAATYFPHITKPSVDKCTPSLTNSNKSSSANVSLTIVPNSDTDTSSHSGHQLKCTEFDSNKLMIDKDCTECNISRADPTASQLVMFLHALSYQGTDWEFHTELPSWASQVIS